MADNVTLPGTGEVIATDDISGVQYQQMKLVDGTLGSTNAAVVDADGRLATAATERFISATSVTAGTNSSAISSTGYSMVRIEMDTSSGTAPTVELSPNGTSGWREAPLELSPSLNGAATAFVASSSGQIRYVNVTGFAAFRVNNTSGSNNCTFNATLVQGFSPTPDVFVTTLALSSPGTGLLPRVRCPFAARYVRVRVVMGTMSQLNGFYMDASNNGVNTVGCVSVDDNTIPNQANWFGGTTTFYSWSTSRIYAVRGTNQLHCGVSSSTGTATIIFEFYKDFNPGPEQTIVQFGATTTLFNGSAANFLVQGDMYDGTADNARPIRIGGRITAAQETAYSNGQRVSTRHDKTGRIVVKPYQHRERVVDSYAVVTSASSTVLLPAQGASIFADISQLVLANTTANNATVTLKCGATLISGLAVPANQTVSISFPVPLPAPTANTDWNIETDIASPGVAVTGIFTLEL